MDSGQVHMDLDTGMLEGILPAEVESLEGRIDLAEAVDKDSPAVARDLVAQGHQPLDHRSLFVQHMDLNAPRAS